MLIGGPEIEEEEEEEGEGEMVLWVFGYGSLIWKAGFEYNERLVGFIKGYRRVFYQGSTDHRGTPEYPGRTVTLQPVQGEVCWGAAYKVSGEEAEQIALTYLEVREKQYDVKAHLDFFTDPKDATPAISGIMVYIASPDKTLNRNYLGPASLEEMADQMIRAEGPSGPNRDYLFQLEQALLQLALTVGCSIMLNECLNEMAQRVLFSVIYQHNVLHPFRGEEWLDTVFDVLT
ncbi:hypothetical protein IFM89_009807 [Coptis chinensis]|uniref:glutathione-specific gamma-glutamylcyclotransferase n=1 Tax=Coptis chinensis TaxID=261450 RepID=A0A835M2L7_9MAGN|nr:hypothetical protein IFM89_009807 [Coptis chinensis]